VIVAHPVRALRAVGLVEGVSFLVLLGVAMPLKYWAGMPEAVKLVGWVHGVLFLAFCAALARAVVSAGWPLARGAMVLVAALLPFGPFLVDRRMLAWAREPVPGGGSPARDRAGA
jgi:integral membrane protein